MSAGYGGSAVVRDIDLDVGVGEVVVVLGANGAGKTTTLLTAAGAVKPMAGTVQWRGVATTASLHRRARSGLRLVTEERSVFTRLSVADNLRIGRGSPSAALDLFPELAPLLGRPAGLLSGGEQQMLTLGRALSARPALLIADELSLGLAPLIVERLLTTVRDESRRSGMSALLVEQHIRPALAVADRGYVMRRGRIEFSGSADLLRSESAAIESTYLSRAAGVGPPTG
ncbi:ABC transporter ATP-binding protein [Pseudonocardia xishanensis]|uniref:ABC transporter ATP-binding protein n=1 Tax=Pseudonocardia xishanensis TaxID=630995 RepID=UPI0031EB0FFC